MPSAIVMTRFGGEAPRFAKQLLPDGYAQYALNSKLTSGDLLPYRLPLYLIPETIVDAETIFPMRDDLNNYYWLMWASDVDVARSVVANNTTQRIYYTGDGVPKATDVNRATFLTTSVKSANYTMLEADYETTIEFDTSSTTFALLPAATAENQFVVVVHNSAASGNVTIDPDGAELIDGAASITVGPDTRVLIRCDGSAWTSTAVTNYPYDYFELGVAAPSTAPTVAYDSNAQAGAYTVLAADAGKTIDCSATPWTLSLTAAATLGNGFICVVRNLGTGTLTVDPNGSELVNGALTLTMESGQVAVLTCNGTSFTGTVLTSGFKAWVYTYVTEWGEESAPSPASSLFLHISGQNMNLSALPSAPPTGRVNVRSIRIYRTNTGVSGTAYQLIDEIAIGTTTYADTELDSGLGVTLPSTNWEPPPTDLIGVTSMANGMVAGFHNNEVCFSEPYMPYSWPQAYRYSVDSPVVAIGALSNSLIITTTGRPYTATGSHPASVTITPIDHPYPCTAKRGLVNMGTGILYPSFEGLVYATVAQPSVATAQLFTRDEWRDVYPQTISGAFYDGKYFGSYVDDGGTRGSFIFQAAKDRLPLFVRTNIFSDASYTDMTTGSYFFLKDGRLFQWDEPTMPYSVIDWWSKEFSLDKPVNFGAAKLEGDFEEQSTDALLEQIIALNDLFGDPLGDINAAELNEYELNGDYYVDLSSLFYGVVFSLYIDEELKWSRRVESTRVFRLPAGFKSDRVSIRLSTNVRIHACFVAETPYALEKSSGA